MCKPLNAPPPFLKTCYCGCGTATKKHFVVGHDSQLMSRIEADYHGRAGLAVALGYGPDKEKRAMSTPTMEELDSMDHDELVKRYDQAAKTAEVGVAFWREELRHRAVLGMLAEVVREVRDLRRNNNRES